MNQHNPITGEIVEHEEHDAPSGGSMVAILQRAEVDQQVATARAFPRSLKRVQARILDMATLDDESAEECMYALPRGGKPITGPSVRFAEIIKQAYGNCRAAARVVHVDREEKYVEAEGIFHDLETNSASTMRVRRRISDKNGKLLSNDMIIVTGNAACSIAKRNAILDGVPKPLWRGAFDQVQRTIAGDATTLSVNREKALKAFAAFGVKPEQVFASLAIAGIEEVTVEHIVTLRGMHSALKNAEATVEEMFGNQKGGSNHPVIENPLADKAPEPAVDQTVPIAKHFAEFALAVRKFDDLSELADALEAFKKSDTWANAPEDLRTAAQEAHTVRARELLAIEADEVPDGGDDQAELIPDAKEGAAS